MKACLRLTGLMFGLALSAGLVWGTITGSISGTVTDPTGAVIPGATVVAVNTQTGIQSSTQTNAAGFYSFPVLPLGNYEVRVQAKGFEEYLKTGLVINVNSALRVDTSLKVGAVSQTVSVSATAANVETSSTQMGDVIGATKMTSLPLNGRSYTDLLNLQPGVAPQTSGEGGGFAVSGNLDVGALSISGQREDSNGFMINGASAEEKVYMVAGIIPNLDSIAEFRIITNDAEAEYGDYAGGLVNVVTKSGTNQFHGDAFEFLRNPEFDARNFYSAQRAVLHQNQFGGTEGGPIWHDEVFFFADYQGTRMVQGVDTGLIPVPSVAERAGDMASVANQLTGTVDGPFFASTLAQELGYPVSSGERYYTGGCTTTAQCVFPNAAIPQSAITAPSKNLMQYIPLPNYQGTEFSTSAYSEPLRDDKGAIRLDANTRLGMIMGFYNVDDFDLTNPYGGASLPGFSARNNGRGQMVTVQDTKTLGPSSVNVLNLDYTRDVQFSDIPVGGEGPTLASEGFTNIYPNNPQQGVESIAFNNYSIGASQGQTYVFDNTYQLADNFSKVVSTHTVKFGGNFSYDQSEWHYPLIENGAFSFNGSETGFDFADFLIGAPSSYAQGANELEYNRSRTYGLYLQDSWRAKTSLTLNYGLRWDVITPWWEAHNEMEVDDPGMHSATFPGAPTGLVFPGDPGIPSTIAPVRYNNFGPRLGLAYSPAAQGGFLGKLFGGSGKTSFRTAYGIYYSDSEERMQSQNSGNAPFGLYWSSPALPMFANPWIARTSGYNYGQRFPVVWPPYNASPSNPDTSINWAQYEPISSAPTMYTGNRVPYAEHYDFSIERQIGAATLLSLSYVGTQGHRLMATVEANPGNPALCLSLSQPSDVLPGTPTCGPYGENGTYYPITGGIITTTRHPFNSDFGSDDWMATMANSNYNAFEASVHRTVGRVTLLAGYTFSKSLDNASGDGLGLGDIINQVNPKISEALSAFNSTNNFVVSYSYRIPIDRLWHPNRLTSDWAIIGITNFANCFPVYIQENDDNSLYGTSGGGQGNPIDEPNRLPGPLNVTNPRNANPAADTDPYFSTSLFTPEAIGQLGNGNRRFFSGPGLNNWSMTLTKELRLRESMTLQFRGEFFNIFNHAQFGEPIGNIDAGPGSFGFVTTANAARIGQVAMKLTW
jgi:hypothetical protein